jgi:glycosyltransferase involved in cell wall biosynthesis
MTARRRLVHVIVGADVGGGERVALDLAHEQRADPELEVAVLFIQSADGPLGAAFRELGVELLCLGMRSGADITWRRYRRALELFRGFDVAHFHVFNALPAFAARRAGCRIVFTVHGIIGHGRALRFPDRVNIALLHWFLNRHVDVVTCNTNYTRALAEERFGLAGVEVAIIPNGVQLDATGPPLDAALAGSIAGAFVVGAVARFAEVKRLDRLIDAFAIFHAQFPASRLLLVGDGPLRPALEQRVAAAGLAGVTVFTGFLDNVRAYERAMSVCVLPSTIESFGLVIVECYAVGVPVIAFAGSGGPVEIISPVEPEDVVPDVGALAARLAFYAGNPQASAARTAARRARAEQFDLRRVAAEFRRRYGLAPAGPA